MNAKNRLNFIAIIFIILITACGGGSGEISQAQVVTPIITPPIVSKFMSSASCAGTVSGAQCTEHVETGIKFWIQLPTNLPKLAPVLLLLHDNGSNGAEFANYIDASTLTDSQGYIGIYPDLTDFSTTFSNDINNLNILLRDLPPEYSIDLNQIIVTGYAAGGAKAYALACQDVDNHIGGVVSISGNLNLTSGNLTTDCATSNNKSILHIHGEIDDISPISSDISAGGYAGVYDVTGLWADQNGCAGTSVIEQNSFELTIADDYSDVGNTSRSGIATLYSYINCDLPVEYAIVADGSHFPKYNSIELENLISDFMSTAASRAIPSYEGEWLTDETINPGTCDGSTFNDSHQISMVQTASYLEVTTYAVLTTNGAIDVISDGQVNRDGSVTYIDEFNDSFGITTATIEIERVDSNNLSATSTFVWNGNNAFCEGDSVYTATRQ